MAKKLFVEAKTETGLNSAIEAGTLNAEVAFVSEQGKEGIHANGKTYQTIPSPEKDGKILVSKDGKGEWADLDMLDLVSYGVEWYPNVADPELTRVGNMQFHKTLPIQSQMKGCVYDAIEDKVVYWLDENDWNYRKNPITTVGTVIDNTEVDKTIYISDSTIVESLGVNQMIKLKNSVNTHTYELKILSIYTDTLRITAKLLGGYDIDNIDEDFDIEIGSRLDGYDGEVMVYVPSFYIRSWDEEDRKCVRISTMKIDDTWEHQPALFVSAYKVTVFASKNINGLANWGYLSKLGNNVAVSIANSVLDEVVGGSYVTSNMPGPSDNILIDQHGKCRTDVARASMRNYARAGNKEIMNYRQYKNIIYWLYVIEYANFDAQANYSYDLTPEGFHTGGLGVGLCSLSERTLTSLNKCNPLIPNGITDIFGNNSGDLVLDISDANIPGVQDIHCARYRGFDNVFEYIYLNLDGILIEIKDDGDYIYVTSDPDKYGDTRDSLANMEFIGKSIRANGNIKEFALGTTAELVVTSLQLNARSYKCDFYYSGQPPELKTLLIGNLNQTGTDYYQGLVAINQSGIYNSKHPFIGFRVVHAANL